MIGTKVVVQLPTKGTLPHLELPCIFKVVLQSLTYTEL